MNITNEIKDYLHYCEYQKKLSEKSVKAYSTDLAQFSCHISEKHGSELTKASISDYIEQLHQKHLPETVKRKVASLKAFLNYLEYEDKLESNPMRKVRTKFKEPKVLPKTIPLKTIEKMLKTAAKEQVSSGTKLQKLSFLRNRAIIETLFATGMRVSEVCTLTGNDIDLSDGSIRIMGKGAKERIIQIGNKEVLGILRKYRNATRTSKKTDTDYFFINRYGSRFSEQSVRSVITKLCTKAGIKMHITPHMFRHSFATLLLEEDVDIRYIQGMLGHTSIQTTQRYTQVSSKKQRQILTTKHPRNKLSLGDGK